MKNTTGKARFTILMRGNNMSRLTRLAIAYGCAIWAMQSGLAQAQWGYPGGFGGCGWMGWGVGTAEGDIARGMGSFLMGAGFYNESTAVADSINTDTIMRWNEYVHEAQENLNRKRALRTAQARERTSNLNDAIMTRLRDTPEPREIFQGSALNVALEDLNDPRIYIKALQGAKVKIGGEKIRIIPFRYNPAALTLSLHQLATSTFPPALSTPEFAAEREALKALDQQITDQVADDKEPDPATVKKLLGTIYAAEEKLAKTPPANALQRKQAETFLKAMHGLVVMLKAPSLDPVLAGVEKRPNATLGELLSFMSAFNLRFGPASTPQQRELYRELHALLVQLRNQVAPALASTAAPKLNGHETEDFFSPMSLEDLKKKAPKP